MAWFQEPFPQRTIPSQLAWWQRSPYSFERGAIPTDAGIPSPGLPAWARAAGLPQAPAWGAPSVSKFPLTNAPIPNTDVDWSGVTYDPNASIEGGPTPGFLFPPPPPERTLTAPRPGIDSWEPESYGGKAVKSGLKGMNELVFGGLAFPFRFGKEALDWATLPQQEYDAQYGPEVPQTPEGRPIPPRLPPVSPTAALGQIPSIDLGIVPSLGAPPMQPMPGAPPMASAPPPRPMPTPVDYSGYREGMEKARPDLTLPEAPVAPTDAQLQEAMLFNILGGLGAGLASGGPNARVADLLLAAAGGGFQGIGQGKREQRALTREFKGDQDRFVGYQRENERARAGYEQWRSGQELGITQGEAAQADQRGLTEWQNLMGVHQTGEENKRRSFEAGQQGQQISFQNALRQYQFETQQAAARAPKIISTAGGMLYTQVQEPDEQGNLRSRVVVSVDPLKQLMTIKALTGSAKEAFKLSGVMQPTNPMFKHYALAGVLDEGGPPVLAAVFGAETLSAIDEKAREASMAAAGAADEKERNAIYLRTRYALMSQLLADPEVQARALQFLGGEE